MNDLEKMSSQILRDVNDGVIVLGPKGRILSMNPRGMEMLGLPYIRQKSTWGIGVSHYILGLALAVMGLT